MSAKPFSDPFEKSSLFKKSVTALVVLTFISIFYGYYYSLSTVSVKKLSDGSEDNQNFWNDWKIVIIIYYTSIGLITFVGFLGIIFDNFHMIFIYSLFMIFFFVFGFVNEALRRNVFGLVVELPTALMALAFAHKIRSDSRKDLRNRSSMVWTTQTTLGNTII